MVQGTSSGAGKSTLVAGLCRIFSNNGYRVVPFKAQNMSSNLYPINQNIQPYNAGVIAMAQAVQAVAARSKPDTRMNPILLKPLGDYRSSIFLSGKFYSDMHAKEYYEKFVLQQGLSIAWNSLKGLVQENDIVVMEGAGSPSEINISKYDIANMLIAEKAHAPVIIVADIERGGCFASIVGTMRLLKPAHRKLVKGFIINKFRGDKSLLTHAIKSMEKITGKPVLGIVPKIQFDLPEEDSLDASPQSKHVALTEESWSWQVDVIAKAIEESIDIKSMAEMAGLKVKQGRLTP
jgi:adenosylcobyric acid synthase